MTLKVFFKTKEQKIINLNGIFKTRNEFIFCTCTQKQAPLDSLYELNPILAFDRINSLIKILLILE